VEAAAWRGRPVFFRIVWPWSKPERAPGSEGRTGQQIAVLALIYLVLIAGSVIAWYNVRAQRADRRGAAKLAMIYFAFMAGGHFLFARHTLATEELSLFWNIVASAGINGGLLWALYLALEPWVRRRWPQTLISWSRYTTKGIRDTLVGRDILFGAGLGCVLSLLKLIQFGLHGSSGEPAMAELSTLLGTRQLIAAGLQTVTGSLFDAIFFFFLLFIAIVILRRQWLAAAGFVVLVTLVFSVNAVYPWVDYPINLLTAALYAFILLRFGLLTLVFTEVIQTALLDVPRTLDFSSWYAWIGMMPLMVAALITIYGFRTSLGGRRLLKDELF